MLIILKSNLFPLAIRCLVYLHRCHIKSFEIHNLISLHSEKENTFTMVIEEVILRRMLMLSVRCLVHAKNHLELGNILF